MPADNTLSDDLFRLAPAAHAPIVEVSAQLGDMA